MEADVRDGAFHLVIGLARTSDPRMAWIASHCDDLRGHGGAVRNYYCLPSDAGGA